MSSTTSSSSFSQMDYMTLLVTQLQYQNPLEPMDNQEMASQMAQFAQLSEVQGIGDSFDSVLSLAQTNYASSLIGKEVTYEAEAEDGTTVTQSGKVTKVTPDGGEGATLQIGDASVCLSDVVSIGG
jgi:flagellar basal-body rod modification protein FlgD